MKNQTPENRLKHINETDIRSEFVNKGVLIRIFLCILSAGILLYSYIDEQNALTRLRLSIPVLAQSIRDLKEENTHLKYEIELFESPQHLLELSRLSEYSHLKQPLLKDIITMSQGVALVASSDEMKKTPIVKPRFTFPIGAKN